MKTTPLERQITGLKIKVYRQATRNIMAALRQYALTLGRKLIAFGHEKPKRTKTKRGTRFS